MSKGQPFTIELAQVTRSRVSFIHILCTYILLQITIYILFFILIKCNFLRCSNISRSKGSVHQLATFKVCCRSHQCDYPSILAAYSGKQHSPWPGRLSASTWPMTPRSQHPHWNESDHVSARSPISSVAYTSQPLQNSSKTKMSFSSLCFSTMWVKGVPNGNCLVHPHTDVKGIPIQVTTGGIFCDCFTMACLVIPTFHALMSIGSLLSSDPARSGGSQILVSFGALCSHPFFGVKYSVNQGSHLPVPQSILAIS